MRFGTCTMPEDLELMERLGYNYIEMSATKTMDLGPNQQEEIRRILEVSKVKCEVPNILFPKTMELIEGNTGEEVLWEYLHRVMALIRGFGAGIAVFGSGKCRRCPKQLSLRETYQKLVGIYRITGEMAGEYGVTAAIESLSWRETNMVNLMSKGVILEADMGMDNIQLLSDYFHVMANRDSTESIEYIRHFCHVHIASGNGRRYPVSEEGEAYVVYFKTLKKVGYNGRTSIEERTDNMGKGAEGAIKLLRELEGKTYE